MEKTSKKIISVTPETMEPARQSLLQDELSLLYKNRSQRFKSLANESPIKDYLLFAADIVDAQELVIQKLPYKPQGQQELIVDWMTPPLNKTTLKRDPYWIKALQVILDHISALPQYKNSDIKKVVKRISAWKDSSKESKATALLAGNIAKVGSDVAPFIWAALSVYWAQLARAHKLVIKDGIDVNRHICPICASDPVASVILTGKAEGVRYLHCNLCESKWHYVRAICTNCSASGKIFYYSLDETDTAIKTESCGDCNSHLKIFNQIKDFKVDPIADDLASLALDALMEEEGYSRSSINPFLFPAEAVS